MGPSEKRRRLLNRNVLIVILVVLIIFAVAYYIITNPPAEPVNALTPDEVMDPNSVDYYVGQTIVVDGYYRNEGVTGKGVITSRIIGSGSTFEDYSGSILPVNHNTPELWNYSFSENILYRFTGVLMQDTPYTVALAVEKVEAI